MPKKKTGQRKKKEKQKALQKNIKSGRPRDDFKTNPANAEMICDSCQRRQKNRFSCYFCSQIQKVLVCCECGRMKCTDGGDCVVRHAGKHVTGIGLAGAICDFCEAAVCHSRKCLQTHACCCLLREQESVVTCVECERTVWEHGGRAFRCATCSEWLCEDDQFEHQASCQVLGTDSDKCISCNRMGIFSCLRCKVCYCAEHVRGHTKLKRGEVIPCKKCGYEVQETKDLAMSVRKHAFGRKGESEGTLGSYGDRIGGGYSRDSDDDENMMSGIGQRMAGGEGGWSYSGQYDDSDSDESESESDDDDAEDDDDEEEEEPKEEPKAEEK
eukprot:GHVQ01015197.1.p1 GENE.GHVQ01015197.1~~GHVQ01015197.1.p1  ORF type:complete len:327 (+),score=58.30 GHVQ01015197.1:354-1334(+)